MVDGESRVSIRLRENHAVENIRASLWRDCDSFEADLTAVVPKNRLNPRIDSALKNLFRERDGTR